MHSAGNTSNRGSSCVIVAVVIVLLGTLVNLLVLAQHAGPRTFENAFERVGGDMGFVKWSSAHQFAEIEPNTLFAIVNGKLVGRFDFQSDSYNTLLTAGVNDNTQRPWINVDHSEGTYHVNCYPKGKSDITTQPTLTYGDTDGDGLTDRKTDWVNKKTYDVTAPLVWSLLKSASESPDP